MDICGYINGLLISFNLGRRKRYSFYWQWILNQVVYSQIIGRFGPCFAPKIEMTMCKEPLSTLLAASPNANFSSVLKINTIHTCTQGGVTGRRGQPLPQRIHRSAKLKIYIKGEGWKRHIRPPKWPSNPEISSYPTTNNLTSWSCMNQLWKYSDFFLELIKSV